MQVLNVEEQKCVAGGVAPAVAIVVVAAAKSPVVVSAAKWVGTAVGAGVSVVLTKEALN